MQIFSASNSDDSLVSSDAVPSYSPAAVVNRRRRRVFALVFLLACAASLAYVFSRPAEYQAAARVQIDFPGQAENAEDRKDEVKQAFLTEVQVLTSRPVIEKLVIRMRADRLAIPGGAEDPVAEIQRSIEARPLAGTTIVQLTASGYQAEPLAPILNTLYEVYRDQLADSYKRTNQDANAQLSEEARLLEVKLRERRRALDEFRARHNIVSLERDENQLLSQVKGAGVSLNAANDKVIAAEARLRSLKESIAAGKAVVRARDNPTLANLEQRYSQAREELRDMERSFTDAYLSFDPKAKSLRIRLADLEQQLKQSREAGQQAALTEAEEELAGARSAAERLSRQMAGDRQAVQSFSARLAEFKTMQEDLGRIEAMHQNAVAGSVRLESGEKGRAPSATLLEPASAPRQPWRPNYGRDAAIGVGGALFLALFAVLCVEFFNRPDARPTVVMAPAWMPQANMGHPLQLGAAAHPMLLPGMADMPRELDESEVRALVDAAAPETRLALVALMSGLSVEELIALRWRAVDLEAPEIRLAGRTLPLAGPLSGMLGQLAGEPASQAGADETVLKKADGSSETAEGIAATIVFAAHDAALERAGEIGPAALRHTYIAFLVRQGARFGDLARLVGQLPADALTVYGPLAPAGPKKPIDDVDRVLPALRNLVPL